MVAIHAHESDYHAMLAPVLHLASDELQKQYAGARRDYQAAAGELRKAARAVAGRLAELKEIVRGLPDTPLSDADGSRASVDRLRTLLHRGERLVDESAFNEPNLWVYSNDPPRDAATRVAIGARVYRGKTEVAQTRTAKANAFAGELADVVAHYRERESARSAAREAAAKPPVTRDTPRGRTAQRRTTVRAGRRRATAAVRQGRATGRRPGRSA
ncbi:hypothetical protein ACFPZ0_12805 [Streptomonospora nanhaiensis]|uniref:Uncharacterized protein n=1 Tax=Streptomonospora nanhaiensis TaxID=1323731 RepID=A0A853BMF4_9ACTN|nr:hypothetical protein [Streptomonospora nanhaiensis]MBV2366652.1 hypothetical protein [Streptomonospora nanhaiensis]MBX9389210.1 hypothetical protein [Streptomonospora nanhaiensis]NYI95847.1 hypothetical protein [Streptomonospora nanhaiensis]